MRIEQSQWILIWLTTMNLSFLHTSTENRDLSFDKFRFVQVSTISFKYTFTKSQYTLIHIIFTIEKYSQGK